MTRRRLVLVALLLLLIVGVAWFWVDSPNADEQPFLGTWRHRDRPTGDTFTLMADHRIWLKRGDREGFTDQRWWVRDGVVYMESSDGPLLRRAVRPLMVRFRMRSADTTRPAKDYDLDGTNGQAVFVRMNAN